MTPTPPVSSAPREQLTVTILGSGSRGNSAVIACGETQFLLDSGFSGIEVQRRMEKAGLCMDKLQGILVTHEHSDHIQSAHTLSHRLKIPIYTTEGTFSAAFANKRHYDWIEIQSGTSFSLGQIDIHPVTLPHDASDPVGFRFEAMGRRCAYITDFGYPSGPVLEALRHCHGLIVEANHDLDMLRNGPYTWPLKQRIASRTGHLSNDALLEIFERILSEEVSCLALAHISENNNHKGLLSMQVQKKLKEMGLSGLNYFLADQHEPSKTMIV